MKKTALTTALTIASMCVAAQSYHVCNSNGTFVEVPLYNNIKVEIDKSQENQPFLRFWNITDDARYYTEYYFAIPTVDSIVTHKPVVGDEVTMLDNSDVTFDASDENSYNEIVETIITDELNDESGDFVENYAYESLVTITFSEGKVTTMPASVTGVTFSKDGGHLTINSTKGKMRYLTRFLYSEYPSSPAVSTFSSLIMRTIITAR